MNALRMVIDIYKFIFLKKTKPQISQELSSESKKKTTRTIFLLVCSHQFSAATVLSKIQVMFLLEMERLVSTSYSFRSRRKPIYVQC